MHREPSLSPPPAGSVSTDPVDRIIRYHVETKHHFSRYSRSLGYLDWANQPDPFRRYDGAPLVPLPVLDPEQEPRSPSYDAIYEQGAVDSRPLDLHSLSRFLELALALSAWKKAGESEWALRSNPSSGNLHPTEGYVLLSQVEGLALSPGLYHYAPKEHGLELRAEYSAAMLTRLFEPFLPGAFLMGLTSVHWREAWKYGERAFRYCNHDIGHAIGTVRIAAATLGWSMALLDGASQDTVAALLGTDREEDFLNAEREHPDCLAVVWPPSRESSIPLWLDHRTVTDVSPARWHGKANSLSREHAVTWDLIDDAARASWKEDSDNRSISTLARAENKGAQASSRPASAGSIIRQRRSAVSFDGKTSVSSATFYRMLQRVMPCSKKPQATRPMPWDAWPYDPAIHLLLFVHRVEGLGSGVYVLVRDPAKHALVQECLNPELNWVPVPGCPDDLPLYWLLEGDAKKLAVQVSCHQDIAGDGAFSFGMLAEFEGPLRERGAWWYPRLFWESGLLGQVLYLEAEAAGVRATGIGCFFDDPVHEVVAVKGLSLQSLYHFTVGGPVEDRRLMTLPPYFHLRRQAERQPRGFKGVD